MINGSLHQEGLIIYIEMQRSTIIDIKIKIALTYREKEKGYDWKGKFSNVTFLDLSIHFLIYNLYFIFSVYVFLTIKSIF